jgi:hypothetical protein
MSTDFRTIQRLYKTAKNLQYPAAAEDAEDQLCDLLTEKTKAVLDLLDPDGEEFKQELGKYMPIPTNGKALVPANGQAKSKFKRAKRVPRSPETWRILRNYPEYEISSHGRVRSLTRAVATDWLKPRFVWHHGKVVLAVRLSIDGKPVDRFIGPLMIQAGFLKEPKWMAKKAETV